MLLMMSVLFLSKILMKYKNKIFGRQVRIGVIGI